MKCNDRSPSGWTLETLAKHLNEKIEDVESRTQERFALSKQAVDSALTAAERAINTAMSAAEKAVTKAETAAEKRFDSVNEFRAAMKDQTVNFADKTQVDFRLSAIEKKIENFAGQVQGLGNVWFFFTSGVIAAVGLSTLITKFLS